MRVTRDNIKDINCHVCSLGGADIYAPMEERAQNLLSSLLEDLDEINAMSPEASRMYIDYEDKHTEYSPERVDPCPDWYGYFTLRWENVAFETIGEFMTLNELDNALCVIYDIVEHNKKNKWIMEKKCLSCRNGFHFYNGMCRCYLAPENNNVYPDNDCCNCYEPVEETAFEERVYWKKPSRLQYTNPATINLNDYVWVELNEHGWKCLTEYYEKLFASVYAFAQGSFSTQDYVGQHKEHTAQHTIDGVERLLTRFQLHEFMNIFGSKMYVGAENICEGNNLLFGLEKE